MLRILSQIIDSEQSTCSSSKLWSDHCSALRATGSALLLAANLHPGIVGKPWLPDGLRGPSGPSLGCSYQRDLNARLCITTIKLLYSTQAWLSSVFLAATSASEAVRPPTIFWRSSKHIHGPCHVAAVWSYPSRIGKKFLFYFLTLHQRFGP